LCWCGVGLAGGFGDATACEASPTMVFREQPGRSDRATPDLSLSSHTGRSVSPPSLHRGWLSAKRGGALATAGARRAAQEEETIRGLLEQRLGLQTARYDEHKELVRAWSRGVSRLPSAHSLHRCALAGPPAYPAPSRLCQRHLSSIRGPLPGLDMRR